jgi:C-terminal processing protease CtpA/Prc
MRRISWSMLLAIACIAPSPIRAQSDSLRVARLTALGRLFGVVRYFHPAFLERDVPWDSAVVATIDAVNAARNRDDYQGAIGRLLASLHDNASRLVATEQTATPQSAGNPSKRWEIAGADSTLIIALPAFADFPGVSRLLSEAAPDVRRAPAIVFDLRGPPTDDPGNASFAFQGIQGLLPTASVQPPAQRFRMHSGFAPQLGGTSGGYWSGTYEKVGVTIPVTTTNRARRTVFLVSPGSDIPDVAFALRSAGQGGIVVEATSPLLSAAGDTYAVDMGEGVVASVRIGESVGSADADTAVQSPEAALRIAVELSKRPVSAPLQPVAPPTHVAPPENAYPGMRYPVTAYRILAAYRYWNAIHYFYPYKHLIGEDWGATLPRMVRLVEAAHDSTEFGLALQTMVTYTNDSHSGVRNNTAIMRYVGALPVAVHVQYIGGQPVVIRVGDDSATRASGIAVGDVVMKVDGEDVVARRERTAKFIAHSTPQALDNAVSQSLLWGNDSLAKVTVRGGDNRERELALPRRQTYFQLMRYPRAGPILRLLPGNVGYADLSLLTVPMVDSMFEMFKNTNGIIFDDRGYPQGTAWAIAPRLSNKPVPAAAFQRPLVMSPDSTQWSTYQFVQSTPAGTKWVYHGKTILLVDERTISQAEHTGLFLEAANKTTIVGSPTMGANGDVTTVALVGGMYASFTGHDVRHADGRQLQRRGLQPDVVVRPTLAGVRAGRDEVLERAMALLKK